MEMCGECGHSAPGSVCSMAAECYRPRREHEFDLHAIGGNLCRCTGYRRCSTRRKCCWRWRRASAAGVLTAALAWTRSGPSQKLKDFVQTPSRSLRKKMDFNDIRTRLQALIAIYTNAYDQAVMPATEDSVRRALAIAIRPPR